MNRQRRGEMVRVALVRLAAFGCQRKLPCGAAVQIHLEYVPAESDTYYGIKWSVGRDAAESRIVFPLAVCDPEQPPRR